MSRKNIERLLAIVSLIILLAAWLAGGAREQGAMAERIANISDEVVDVTMVRPSVFEGHRKGRPEEKLYIAMAEHPSYGGPLQVAVAVNSEEQIEQVAIVQSTDTSTYLKRVVGEGVLDAFLGKDGAQLPHVDAVSGATLSSTAIVKGVEKAVAHIRNTSPETEPVSPLSRAELTKALLTVVLFLAAFSISSRYFRWNRKYARLGLLALSTIILGFLYGAQFSLSSLVLLLGGFWTRGMASYAALICLVLAVAIFFLTRKNLYCAMICPFGGIQEGLSRITGCSAPKRAGWMKWTARFFALFAMSTAVYFRNPSDALYEPFGMAFSFIGSTFLFALTILIIVASLVVKRPWCALLCPVTCVFDYLACLRGWLMPGAKKREVQE